MSSRLGTRSLLGPLKRFAEIIDPFGALKRLWVRRPRARARGAEIEDKSITHHAMTTRYFFLLYPNGGILYSNLSLNLYTLLPPHRVPVTSPRLCNYYKPRDTQERRHCPRCRWRGYLWRVPH